VFTDINVPSEYFVDTLKKQAVVNAGVHFEFVDETGPEGKTKTEFFYENGITDYVNEVVGVEAFTPVVSIEGAATGRDREDRPEYKVKMAASFCFSNKIQMIEYYHNSSFLEHGGSPERALKTAFVNQIDAYLKAKGLYKKDESRITFTDVQDCLVYVSSSFSTITSYENQTKKSITNRFIAQAMTEFLKQNLEIYFIENPEEAQKICQQVLVNKQSREHAEKTRQSLKKTIATQMDMNNRVQKFVDCRSKDPAVREIYIVEGDSALGAVKTSRNAEFQAIMPVRGKILNCLKADYGRIFKSDIIADLIKVLGCGVEISGGKSRKDLATFDIDALRWNKVIICTDADVDGFQIRTLILTMIYRLMPTLITEGYIYIAETPLYEITTKNKTYFAYSEGEKADILAKIGEDAKYTLQRSKGLGENDPEMMWLTTMNPETRRLVKVTPEESARTADVFDLLLGDNLAGRKEHIANHGYEYLDELDVS
ncbi:DNA topoisomerase, partial [Ruminococcaceae bacterium OttesenSCG-928-A11]|nr:DNA topoisomerase [Ruminococcaceae bacterium OttesenSCG-928-A11]